MTTIKLEIPSSDEIAMFHMGEALRNMAVDYGYVVPSKCNITHTETVGDVSRIVKVENYVPVNSNVTLSTCDGNFILSSSDETEISDSIDDITKDIAAEHDRLLGVSDTIDADGLPWDQRIHSRGKTRLDDNTWRMARKPKDKTDEEWAEYVEGVKVELRELMAIPVTVTYDPFAVEPPVVDAVVTPPVVEVGPFYWEHPESDSYGVVQTREELESYLESDPCCVEITKEMYDKLLSESKDVVIPPPLVTPPVVDAVVTPPVVDAVVTPPVVDAVVTPPVVDAPVVTGPTTFPELMKFITVNNKKLTKESVDEALKAQGLASIALLAARTDLIPQVHAALVKLL